jgi:hypothetical protein
MRAPANGDRRLPDAVHLMPSSASDIWTAVERLVDRAASLDDLRAHRIHLLAGRRWRADGRA